MSGRRGWTLSYDGFRPTDEGLREALCTLGNGYFATRGAAEEAQADDTHYPGTYVAGLYNRLETTIAGRTITNEDLVNCPNWLPLTFRVGDEDRWFNMRAVGITEYRQTLDMKAGVLLRHIAFTDPGGRRFRLEARRLVHRERPHLAAIEWVLTSPDWSGPVTVRSGLDGSVINAGVARYRELSGTHLDILQTGEAGPAAVFVLARTLQSRIEIAVAARTRLFRDGAEIETNTALVEREGFVANDLTFTVAPDDAVRVEKVAALYTSRDFAIGEAAAEARAAASGAPAFGDLYESHARAQDAMWRRVDVELDTDGDEQAALRLNVFHVAQCISVGTLDHDVGVPARGLHGEAYRGHVFWDELFVFPPLTGKLPELTRSLLKYRYRRLEAARRMAGAAGLRGALFPWQSGSSGREETQQFHLNPALRPLAAGQLAPAAPRQLGDRLQRLALLSVDAGHAVPAPLRRRDGGRDRPAVRQPSDVQRGGRALRDQRRHGSRRIPRRLSRSRRAGAGQQRPIRTSWRSGASRACSRCWS